MPTTAFAAIVRDNAQQAASDTVSFPIPLAYVTIPQGAEDNQSSNIREMVRRLRVLMVRHGSDFVDSSEPRPAYRHNKRVAAGSASVSPLLSGRERIALPKPEQCTTPTFDLSDNETVTTPSPTAASFTTIGAPPHAISGSKSVNRTLLFGRTDSLH